MPNNTDSYLVIRSFIDKNGNTYQSRETPYLYGELPLEQRDNINFCVPKNSIEIKEQVLNVPNKEYLGRQDESTKPIEIRTQQIQRTFIPTEVEAIIDTEIVEENIELVENKKEEELKPSVKKIEKNKK